MKIRRDKCLLCGVGLDAIPRHGIQRHPLVNYCRVAYTDSYGVCLTDEEVKIAEAIIDEAPQDLQPEMGMFDLNPPVDFVLGQMFNEFQLPRLGGASTGKGWSSFATAQRCLYLWRKRYVEKTRPPLVTENEHLAIGTLVHTLLALFYANMLGDFTQITPQVCYDYLIDRVNPSFVKEGWRIFSAYRLYYTYDEMRPLAVEYDLKDPRTGESTRYDLIAFFPKITQGRLPGTYLVEHKTSGRFDWDTLEGWANDGEVIGEAALWRSLGLAKRFGPLQGVIVNIVGKQQEPKFHRTTVIPEGVLVKSHLDDLRRWDGLLALCKATNNFPRSRANCVNRFGRCDWWEHCVTGAP
jgi:hypothetical protein